MAQHCQPCERSRDKREAIKFCVDCDEYLCDQCFDVHRKIKGLQKHVFVNDEKEAIASNDSRATSKQCEEHIEKRLEYFCTNCNVTGCSDCVSKEHSSCKTVFIPDVPTDLDLTQPGDNENADEKIKEVIKGINGIRPRAQANISEVKEKRDKIVKGLENFKEKVIAIFNVLCEDISQLAEQTAKEDELYCDALIRRSQNLLSTFEHEFKNESEDDKTLDQRSSMDKIKAANAMFLRMPRPDRAGASNTNHSKSIEKMAEVETFVASMNSLVHDTKELAIPESRLTNMSTETESDEEQNRISGALVTGNRLLVADRGNKKVKVFDTVNNLLLAQLMLPDLFMDT